MSLTFITGPVRSGKSSLAERLARAGGSVTVVVAGRRSDDEMVRRIDAHQARRPKEWRTVEVTPEGLSSSPVSWLAEVGGGDILVLDCLGTLLGAVIEAEGGEASEAGASEAAVSHAAVSETAASEAAVSAAAGSIVAALTSRGATTIVVSNEVGWGIVPQHASARLFRDVLGRANRTLTDTADRAWLVVAGRCIDLKAHPRTEDIT